MRNFSFNGEVAKVVGADAAVIYQNIKYWCEKNAANNKHGHDGYHWTYNTAEAFKEIFYHLSESQIRRALSKLKEADLIVVGEYNENPFDKTKWYSFKEFHASDEIVNSKSRNRKMSSDEIVNCTSDEIVSSYKGTDINTDIKPDINKNNKKDFDDEFEFLWKSNPNKKGKDAAKRAWFKALKKSNYETIAQGLIRYFKAWSAEGVDSHYMTTVTAWLNDEAWASGAYMPHVKPNSDSQLDGLMAPTSDNQLDNLFPEEPRKMIQ